MKGYILVEHGKKFDDYKVYMTKKEFEKAFAHAIKSIGESTFEVIECNIDTRGDECQKRIETAFCNVGDEEWPEDIVEHLEDENTGKTVGRYRYNRVTGKSAIVWEPFEMRTNQELINYIETGSFNR